MIAPIPEDLLTIGDTIRWAATRFETAGVFYGHGTDNAIDEAAALVLGVLRLPPALHAVYFACRLTPEERQALAAAVADRVENRRPVPYILGRAWFCGLEFCVDERVLIPRSPLAELIESGFQPWVNADRVHRVVDVGTGSGCIAVACALAFPEARVDALDIDPSAVSMTAYNARAHGVSERVCAQPSDLLEALPAVPAIDLIVSNPPYVDAQAMASLPPEFRHEPRDALAAGPDGMDTMRRLLPQAARRLGEGGILVAEVGHGASAFERAFPDLPVIWVDLDRGGAGVFVVDADTLRQAFPEAAKEPVNQLD